MKQAHRRAAAARPRTDAADRRAAGGGLLLRLGQPDLLDIAFDRRGRRASSPISACCSRSASPSGLARENHGAAGLAGVVGYLVATKGAKVLIAVPPEVIAGVRRRLPATSPPRPSAPRRSPS